MAEFREAHVIGRIDFRVAGLVLEFPHKLVVKNGQVIGSVGSADRRIKYVRLIGMRFEMATLPPLGNIGPCRFLNLKVPKRHRLIATNEATIAGVT